MPVNGRFPLIQNTVRNTGYPLNIIAPLARSGRKPRKTFVLVSVTGVCFDDWIRETVGLELANFQQGSERGKKIFYDGFLVVDRWTTAQSQSQTRRLYT